MEPSPLTSLPNPGTTNNIHPDSAESSPRSNVATDALAGEKLRLMCSYGGHIIPRPHDKSLCYVGGDTRLVVVDRHSSLAVLTSHLARTLLNGRPFTIKYQLPHEDLDSLVLVSIDEDLENMIEEYDRISSSSSAPARIRLFLFFNKPETAASMGSLLDDAKTETWFVDALNGSMLLSRNLSDSATMGNSLVNLDVDDHHNLEVIANGVAVNEDESKQFKNVTQVDVNLTMPDSPMVDTSSYGSSSSSPSLLPPIKVRVEDKNPRIDEQFAQTSLPQVMQKTKEDGQSLMHFLPPPIPATISAAVGTSDYPNQVLSDDETSDQGIPIAYRKPPLPLQPFQVKQKLSTYYNLPSPDSVASDTSIQSATLLSKPVLHEDQANAASPDTKDDLPIQSAQVPVQSVHNPGYALPLQLDPQQQQQFTQANKHFVPVEHHTSNTAAAAPYYPVYAATPQQQLHHQQYPVYVMPISQTRQPYMCMQPPLTDATSALPSSRPLTTPAPASASAATSVPTLTSVSHPPKFPPKPTAAKPEISATMYRTAGTSTPQVIQVPANQFQQQFMGYSQPIPMTPANSNPNNYGYGYGNADHDHVYYTQNQHQATAAWPPLQYQSMNPAAAVALTDGSMQQQQATNNMVQQFGTSQP